MTDRNMKKVFQPGEDLMVEGDKGKFAYIIESGHVEILVKRNNQLIQVGTRGEGSIIGEMAMLDDQPRTATVRATSECHVVEISRTDFSSKINNLDPVLKMTMHVILTRYRDMLNRSEFSQNWPPELNIATEDIEKRSSGHERVLKTVKVYNELKLALDKGELEMYYQPMIEMKTGKIAGFEALMRWQNPEKGLIPPNLFIPVAEESKMIVEMTKWAFDRSCLDIQSLQHVANHISCTDKPLFMSINFSATDFEQPDFIENIEKSISKTQVNPERLHVELTERLLVANPENAKKQLEACNKLGMDISLDDFGTGYSSLSYLHYFPIDTLKIDRSFISSMLKQRSSFMLIKSIIGLAKNMEMRVIAEGIETADEARTIQSLGCDYCQGFLFAKAMPYSEVSKFVMDWNPPNIALMQ